MHPALLADVMATKVLNRRALFKNESRVRTGRFLIVRVS
jgi:hypothetical protein